jgi:hypothetical protein
MAGLFDSRTADMPDARTSKLQRQTNARSRALPTNEKQILRHEHVANDKVS